MASVSVDRASCCLVLRHCGAPRWSNLDEVFILFQSILRIGYRGPRCDEPIRNPDTGTELWARTDLPDGFENSLAEIGRADALADVSGNVSPRA